MRIRLFKLSCLLAILLLSASPALAANVDLRTAPNAASAVQAAGTYTNPLPVQIPGDGLVESCADPTIIYGQTPDDPYWYMYCTTDPLNDEDKTGDNFNFHLIPMLRSSDLINWEYMGDAFAERPGWVADDAGLWAPEIQY
ncbi:MAG: arabinan endo-1,5-alpha-L-arabinosidase, partial [Chloroflexota bacterium]|nr:arabinan endo-1,5-alpha-L-arabinosidase [Chloroflexota bacterium]